MYCPSCGRTQAQTLKCSNCQRMDSLNARYLEADRDGDHEKCREIAEELITIGGSYNGKHA
jgi:predicted ATP-dependent serine protease